MKTFCLFITPFLFAIFFLLGSPLYPTSHPPQKITAYFTPSPAPVSDFETLVLPGDLSSSTHSAYQAVVRALAAAEKSIYLAVYEFNIYHLSQVLQAKLEEGVKIFLLVEADSLKLPETHFLLGRLHRSGAQIIPDQKKGGIMHNKFAVIDQRILITGSANYSINAFFQQYNDVVIVDHPGLARKYLKRFTELTEKIYRKRSSRLSLKPEVFQDRSDPSIHYQAVFSRATFDPTQILINVIHTCKKNVSFLIFAFSSRPITEAMKNCLRKGKVTGIFDNAFESENITQNWGTIPFQILWDAGADVKYDNVKEKIHHKTIVIDDRTVVTGSFNFSGNAQKNNDENYLIIRSPELARQYLDRFQALWKKFPSETLFETYMKAYHRKQTTLSFQQYEQKFFRNRVSKVYKELKGGNFQGKVVLVEDGNTVVVALAKSGERVRVTLAGIIAPVMGTHGHNQQPQSHLAKEGLLFLSGQRVVTGKVVAGEGYNLQALLYTKDGHSLSAAMVRKGLVYPLVDASGDSPTPSYENHPAWKAELPHLRDAWKTAQKEKRMLWGDLSLKVSPLEFLNQLEEEELQKRLTENQYSLAKFEKNVWIGNRKTGKAYPPGSPTYMEYLRDLNDKKLIFFKDQADAKAAGYLIRNEKNY